MKPLRHSLIAWTCIVVVGLAILGPSAAAQDRAYLSTEEVAAISGFSLTTLTIGHLASRIDSGKTPLWSRPFGFERTITRKLGGTPQLGKRNFLDDNFGAAATAIAAGAVLFAADEAYPSTDRTRDILQDQFLFFSGLATVWGITDLAKGLVARPRPLVYLEPELAATRPHADFRFDHGSFFSGHSATAFFSMTYLNLRIRDIMRQEMSPGQYRNWRWLSPTLSFGWASIVAISRLHAYRHYLTDVAAGALVGFAAATLFYSLGDDLATDSDAASSFRFQIILTF